MFRALSTLVADQSITKEIAEAIDTEITSALKGLKDEREALTIKNKELTSSFDKVQAAKELLEKKTVDIDAQIKQAKEDGKADTVKILEQERASHASLTEELAGFESENKSLRVENAINSEIAKYKVKSDLVGDAKTVLSGLTKVTDEGIVFGDNGASVEEGVKAYFETRGSYLDAVGNAGSGATSGGGSGGQVKTDLSGDMKSRTATIQARMDAVK